MFPRWYPIFVGVLSLFVVHCGSQTKNSSAASDPFLSLEDAANPQTKAWIQRHNEQVQNQIGNAPLSKTLRADIRKILLSKERIPMPSLYSSTVRNFWQDEHHVRGIWRTASLEQYQKQTPAWTTLLDVDQLNKQEKKSWVFQRSVCLPPEYERCLIYLSDGGKDESVIREFSVSQKKFVENGFYIGPGKNKASWLDADHLIVGLVFEPDSTTTSGYPRTVRVWKRGTDLKSAKLLFEGHKRDVSDHGFQIFSPDGNAFFISQGETFFEEVTFLVDWKGDNETPRLIRLPFPKRSELLGLFKGQLLYRIKEDWQTPRQLVHAGTVVSLPYGTLSMGQAALDQLEIVYKPDAHSNFEGIEFTRDHGLLNVLHNVQSEILDLERTPKGWVVTPMNLPRNGSAYVVGADAFASHNRAFVFYESFLTPPTLYLGTLNAKTEWRAIKSLPSQFQSKNFTVTQETALSKDGTQIPYYLVRPKNAAADGKTPTILTAYGGFEISEMPFYLGAIGKIWLERGGAFAMANIRGGGEFGPKWHQSARKENRQRAYDDFAAVAKNLFQQKFTSPPKLGIYGGSNGGLLMGVAMTQTPAFYNAVFCMAPLLDMIRYTQLPPGASWIDEYGDPADSKAREFLSRYSPYQNVKDGVKYPSVFFFTSTADDRVHPGHARKMAAKLDTFHADSLYFENMEGGHSGSADLEQRIQKLTLQYTYFHQRLMGDSGKGN